MKKNAIFVISALLFTTVFAESNPNPDELQGIWVNSDLQTRGITKLLIGYHAIEYSRTVRAYGKCHPVDCDWGQVLIPYDTNSSATAAYQEASKSTRLDIKLLSPDSLLIHATHTFSDGRYYEADYYMERETKENPTRLLLRAN